MAGPQNCRAKQEAAQCATEGHAQAHLARQELQLTCAIDALAESKQSTLNENEHSNTVTGDCSRDSSVNGQSDGESDIASGANGEDSQDVGDEMPGLQVEDSDEELEVEELEGEELDESLQRRESRRQAGLDSSFSLWVNESRSACQWKT
ncbi:hypothetical protein BC835DRAFT_1311582 [Cytidiella melzeri]|nr:hypothetical protein BC835DRAFT_1311582 [Cytidiella melzeri]